MTSTLTVYPSFMQDEEAYIVYMGNSTEKIHLLKKIYNLRYLQKCSYDKFSGGGGGGVKMWPQFR